MLYSEPKKDNFLLVAASISGSSTVIASIVTFVPQFNPTHIPLASKLVSAWQPIRHSQKVLVEKQLFLEWAKSEIGVF